MPTINVHLVPAGGGAPIDLQCKTGQSLMQAAVKADVEAIVGECGGTLTCATCHVYVREPFAAKLDPVTSDEDSMLDFAASPREPNSRLSCQIKLTEELDGLTVDLPATQY
jgi:2Fe-2S ferredoxin